MVITRLSGGMGNQMFQYALGRALSLKYGVPLKFDNSMQVYLYEHGFAALPTMVFRNYELDLFDADVVIAAKSDIPWWLRCYSVGKLMPIIDGLRRRLISHKGRERGSGQKFDLAVLELGPNVYLDGDWQSYKYFEQYAEQIKKDFTLKNELPQHIKVLETEIKHSNALCVHVRRGDYVGNSFHDVVTKEYYDRALAVVMEKTSIDHIYVFSDDIEWCKEVFRFDTPTTFVGPEYAGDRNSGHFALMQACAHFIIANSSFSWWAAWLGQTSGTIVVAPKQWFTNTSIDTSDLIPRDWIRA